jgi:signal peptidase II
MDAPQPAMQPRRFNLETLIRFIRNYWRDYVVMFMIAGIIIGFDQWTKILVRGNIPLGGDWLPGWLAWLMPFARVRYWYNSGAAFGIFQNGNMVFMILAIIVAGIILYYLPRTARKDWWLRLALAMQFSGAVGNLVDRIQFGHVTDFISVGSFAIFNVADASISVGVAVLILGVWISDRAEKRTTSAQAAKARMTDENDVKVPKNEANYPNEEEVKGG